MCTHYHTRFKLGLCFAEKRSRRRHLRVDAMLGFEGGAQEFADSVNSCPYSGTVQL